MKNIYIGYDSREAICYDVCKKSIQINAKENFCVQPLKVQDLTDIYNREKDPLAATEFAYTRFLVPYLNSYNGVALFCDCDFIFLDDIAKITENLDDTKAVY